MNALPPNFRDGKAAAGPMPAAGRASFGAAAASATSMKWAALQDAAAVVATLAGLDPERPSSAIRNFPAVIRDAGNWRRETAEKGIDDLAAIMEPGIAALLAVNARGADSAAPALALWREFHAARVALLALAPPAGDLGPRRSA
jgi:hypothetical protein